MSGDGLSNVPVPGLCGFVYDPSADVERRREVVKVWCAYYFSLGTAQGIRWPGYEPGRVGVDASHFLEDGEFDFGGPEADVLGGSREGFGDVRSGLDAGVQRPVAQGAASEGVFRAADLGSNQGHASLGRLPRGRNFERNQANRVRKKAAKLLRQGKAFPSESVGELADDVVEKRGFFSDCSPQTQRELRESRAKLLVLENERKALQEKAKISRLKSPIAYVEEALRLQGISERCKDKTDKVSSWARTVTSGSAVSVAKSAPSTIPSLTSVTSSNSASAVKGVKYNGAEEFVMNTGLISEFEIKNVRKKMGRPLDVSDFVRKDAPFTMTVDQKYALTRYIIGLDQTINIDDF